MTNQTTISTQPSLRALIADDAYCMTFQSLPQYRAALLQSLAALANQPALTAPTAPAGDALRADANRYQMLKKHAFNRTVQGFDGPILQWTLTVPACEDDCADFDAAMDQYGSLADYVPHYPALAHQPAQEQAEPTWGAVETVGDMVRNLLTLDQAAPVFTAFHVTIDGQRRCRVTQGITISRERVVDGKWIDSARKDVPYANIVWAKPDERAQQEPVAAPHQAAAPGALLAILRDVHDTLESQSDSDIDHFEDDEEEREGAPMQYAARRVMEVMDILKAAAPSAPSTPEAPKPPFPISDDEMAALRRFWECATDDDGYDVSKRMMQRLADMGLVQRKSGSYYMSTDFGLYVLGEYTVERAAQLDGGQGKGKVL